MTTRAPADVLIQYLPTVASCLSALVAILSAACL